MIWNPFKATSQNCLGIDIGTSSIRIIELSSSGKKKKLENYGELSAEVFSKKPFKVLQQNSSLLSNTDITEAILAILSETKMKTKKAVFSISDFSSFFTWFTLPWMNKEELPDAVRYEARQHIPFPLSEVVLDWQIIKEPSPRQEKKNLKILLVSVPKEVIEQYREVASLVHLELFALEAEVFGLCRALIKDKMFSLQSEEQGTVAIVDIGSQSTTASVIDRGVLKRSHSFDIAGNELTHALSKSLGLERKKAEEIKQKYGLSQNHEFSEDIRRVMLPFIDLILIEVEKVCQNFYKTEEREIRKIIMAGGEALIPGLDRYFSEYLKMPVEIANPFSGVFYPSILENNLKKMGPLYAVAVGVGMRGIE